jgi:hypothetical protein
MNFHAIPMPNNSRTDAVVKNGCNQMMKMLSELSVAREPEKQSLARPEHL